MRLALFMIFMSVYLFGHGQTVKLGFRSGASFSNFYAHHSLGEIPNFTIQPGSNDRPLILDPSTYNDATYYYKTDFIKNLRTGFFSYLYMDLEIRQRLSAEIGLGYTQKGIDIEYNLYSTSINSHNNTVELSYQFKRNLRLDYISIPLTFQYKVGRKERFYVMAGIYNAVAINFLIKKSLVSVNQQTFDSYGNINTSGSETWTPDAYASLFDTGLLSGFGVNFPVTKKVTAGIDIRGTVGLIDIPKRYEEYGFQSFSETTKNISFETGLKLQYKLK